MYLCSYQEFLGVWFSFLQVDVARLEREVGGGWHWAEGAVQVSMQVGVLHSDAGFHSFLFITHTLALVGTRENEIFLWLPRLMALL